MASKVDAAASVPIHVQLLDAKPDDKLEALQALLFDRNGGLAASTTLKVSRDAGGALLAQGAMKATRQQLQSGRLVVSPMASDGGTAPPSRQRMERQLGAFTEPLQLDLREPKIALKIARPFWERWPHLCGCWIRGRLIKRVLLPNGQIVDLPICHSRVTICEVDRWRLIIDRFPWADLLRLRTDLLEVIRRRLPIPEPEPDPFPHALSGLLIQPTAATPRTSLPADASARIGLSQGVRLQAAAVAGSDLASLDSAGSALRLRDVSAAALRADLLAHIEVLRPYFCWIPWLEPWFIYTRQCYGPVSTDEQGRFSFLYVHDCHDLDQPDIYISAEQLIGGSWTTIHAPPLRCHTIWNYHCGDEITVVVSDPRALPCVPDVPTEPPGGVDRWVMPMAIGGTWIAGTAAPGPVPPGWVRPDGMTDYGGIVNAPFGATLGFRQQHALTIPNVGANGQYYYRWSFRPGTSGGWTKMLDPVSRTYVRDVPGPNVQFPAVQLGPQPGELFRFKPALFSPADWGISTAGDPAGTQYYWPVDNSIGDIYAARWTTPGTASPATAPALAGNYQVKLEVFDSLGNLVMPGAGTFSFVVPDHFSGDTLFTRVAAASELDGGGFVFTVLVDNSRCSANIQPPTLSTGVGVDDCGFLRYTAGTALTLAFDAVHPHNRATFGFSLIRGVFSVPDAGAGGEVGAVSSGFYAGSGSGNFSHAFPVSTLLGPVPGHPDSCVNAAFSANLDLDAKATDGNSRISSYDAGFVRAFALAVQ
nr:hypothetical protein [uncultured Roseateles sp.]